MAEQTFPLTDRRPRLGHRAAPPHGASVRSHPSRQAAQ
jgi:hypothetical protein